MSTKTNKLVRDGVPKLIRDSGGEPRTKILDDLAFAAALKHKLIEEANELVLAVSRSEMLEELADILEVMSALCDANQIAWSEVESAQGSKRESRGGFEGKVFLIETLRK